MLALLSMLSSTVSLLSREDVKAHTSLLLELFTAALDYRVTQANVRSFIDNFLPPSPYSQWLISQGEEGKERP